MTCKKSDYFSEKFINNLRNIFKDNKVECVELKVFPTGAIVVSIKNVDRCVLDTDGA